MYKRFDCCIIGQTNLTLQCAEILWQAGHRIKAIITTHRALNRWAQQRHIACSDSLALLECNSGYDYLFSIVNDVVLPLNILKQPQRFAINFHDSLLPRYAGIHATSWAIINGETEHGITWHIMKEGIDRGEILQQATITIDPEETAFSLNLSCYEKAKKLFTRLVRELATKTYLLTPQNQARRSYYGRYHKPPGNGLIDWNSSARAINSLVRALQFGNQPNTLSSAKLILFENIYLIKDLIITPQISTEKPGTLVDLTTDSCRIATKTYDILITELLNNHGRLCSLQTLFTQFLKEKKRKFNIQPNEQMIKLLHKTSTLFARHELYWIAQLNQAEVFPVPFLRSAHVSQFSRKQQKLITEFTIPNSLMEKLKKKFPKISLKIIFLSAFIIYFQRTFQQKKISIGISYPKIREEITGLELFFSSNLPFTITLKDNLTFWQALETIRRKFNQIKQHSTFLTDVMARYPKSKSMERGLPLNINFSENLPSKNVFMPGEVNIFILGKKNRVAIYTSLSNYNAFLKKILTDLKDNLIALIDAASDNPKKSIIHLNLMNPKKTNTILYKWGTSKINSTCHKTVHELFEEQVFKNPDQTAIIFEGNSLSYHELNNHANKLAHTLLESKITRNSLVVICVERSLEMVIGLLGILKSGAAYIPIEPDYPILRIKKIFEDSQPFAFVTQGPILSQWLDNNDWINVSKIIKLDVRVDTHSEDIKNPKIKSSPEDLAYVIYTSGSTGNPKGVLINHHGVVNCIQSIKYHAKITSKDMFFALTSIAFDIAAMDYFLPFSIGAKTLIVSRIAQKTPQLLINLINKLPLTVIQSTPSTMEIFHLLNWRSPKKIKILVAGETLSPNLAKYLLMNGTLSNIYGPTETTIYSTFARIKSHEHISIGKPVFNTKVCILDVNLQLLPIGFSGELYIGGIGLARGYLNQPELTRSKFIQNPFSSDPNDRLYKTGDLARWLPDGNLEYLGRIDDQVKIRGFRISLGEVEQALLNHQAIAQATVLINHAPTQQPQLLAFIVLDHNVHNEKSSSPVNIAELKSFLAQSLPDYMVPAAYVILDAFPLTSNGKVDKKKLLTYSKLQTAIISDYSPPQTPIEKQLALLWQNILRIERISLTDDFFSLGGDSILAMQLIAKANTKYGLSFTVKDLISFPTIAGLANKVSLNESLSQLNPENLKGEVALTPIQHWFFEHGFKNPAQWSQICLLRLNPAIKIDYLLLAIKYLFAQHDSLYLRYQQEQSGWRQHYSQDADANILFVSIIFPNNMDTNSFIDATAQWLQIQFDLNKGPLAGIAIIVDATSKTPIKLLFALHHLLVDGVSWRILLSEIENTYPYFTQQQTPPSIPATVLFSRWSEKLQQLATQGFFTAEQSRWQKIAQQCKPLPQDFTGSNLERASKSLTLYLDKESTQALTGKIHAVYRTQINDILLAALLRTVADWSQHETMVLDLESHGRYDDLMELNSISTVGWFTNLFPVALTLHDRQWQKLLPDVKQQLKNIPNQGLGYGVLRYLKIDMSIPMPAGKSDKSLPGEPTVILSASEGSPHTGTQAGASIGRSFAGAQDDSNIRPQIAFNYWGNFSQHFEADHLFSWENVKLLSAPENERTHLINIDCVIHEERFNLSVTYSQNHYTQSTITHLINAFRDALLEIVEHCLTCEAAMYHPADFPLANLSEQQLRHLIHTHTDSRIENIYPLTPTQQGLIFEQWRNPDAPHYQVQARWKMRGELDLFALKRAFEQLFRQHEVLRAHISWQESAEALQIIQQEVVVPWRVHDLRPLSYAEQHKLLAELIALDQKNILSIETAPLAQIQIILMADDHYEIICHFHHVILDGWSFSILLHELHNYYQAAYKNEVLKLSAPVSFSRYIHWLQQQNWQAAKIFWCDYLSGFKQPIDLGAVGVKAAPKNSPIADTEFLSLQLSFDLSTNLRDFSKLHGVRLNALFQGVWGILLHRYTQLTDIVFGITVSGRAAALEHIDTCVGLFINTLPLRLTFSSELTVLQYLKQLQNQIMLLLSFDYTPLGYIQEWNDFSGPEKFLFDSLVVFENYPKATSDSEQDISTFTQLEFWDPTHYALTLQITPADSISLKIGFDSNRIDPARAQHVLEKLQYLLQLMLSQPVIKISALSLLSFNEYQQLLALPNTLKVSATLNTILENFEQQARNHPSHPALIFQEQVLSYQQLNHQANQLAHYLDQQGATAAAHIAVHLPRSPELIVSLLAIWKVAGVYLPLDYKYPLARINSILASTKAAILITQEALISKQRMAELTATLAEPPLCLFWEQLSEILATHPATDLQKNITLNHAAYILHTSGTTGTPKGIVHEHKTLANLINWQTAAFSAAASRNITQLANMSFDVFLQEVSYTLSNGYTLHIVPSLTKQSLTELLHFISQRQINQIFLPTGLLEPLCESALYLKNSLFDLTDMIVAGEKLKISSSIRNFFLCYPHIRLTNQYGPTETHVASAYTLPEQNIEHWPTFPPIGSAIANMQLVVLDNNLQPLPPETPGELYLHGIGLARGYVNNPEQTTQRFITTCFIPPHEDDLSQDIANDIPMTRTTAAKSWLHLYKTGDKAKRRVDGQFEYLGRLDEQVKIRGFRVELGEIEMQILRQPGIRQCVVTTVPDASHTLTLVCYLVPDADHALDHLSRITDLKQALAKTLPDYMLPSHFHWLEEMPLTANGKVDKNALPKHDWEITIAEAVATLSSDIYTQKLVELWQKILGVTPTDNNQNFFTLGGHSLSALRLLLEIEKHFAVKLSLSDFLQFPTLGQLSLKLHELQNNQLLSQFQLFEYFGQSVPFPIVPLQSAGDKTPLFLVHPIGGTVFWFVHLARCLGEERPVYGIQDPSIIQQTSVALFSTMEELAAFYVYCLRKIQPQGPYLLAGSSFGATCAFEMAKQLTANGESVKFLGLLDGWAFYPDELRDEKKFKQLMCNQVQDLKERFHINQVDNVNFWVNLQWQRSQLLWKYVLAPLNLRLTLFKAQEAQPDADWPDQFDNGWSDFSSVPLAIYNVPGNHETMFYPPNVQFLAESINEIIS